LAEGDRREALAVSETGIAFVLSPQGERVAFARPDRQSGMLYTSVTVMDLDTREQRNVARGQIAAFFWSPDGGKLAVLSLDENSRRPQGQGAFIPILHADRPPAQSSSVRLIWSIVNLAAGSAEDAPPFRPTDSFLLLIPYFDQYAQSLSLWSPDSRYLILADLDQDERAAIRVLDTVQPKQPARWLAEGSFAAWSWR
jgi:hypothetical protein